jgi:hypothetical protein
MKTLIPIFVIFLFVGSCKKEVCYTCTTSTFSKYDDHLINSSDETLCDKSEMEILNYETDHFNFDDPASYTTCECKKE